MLSFIKHKLNSPNQNIQQLKKKHKHSNLTDNHQDHGHIWKSSWLQSR